MPSRCTLSGLRREGAEDRLFTVLCNYLSLGQFQLAVSVVDELFPVAPARIVRLLRSLALLPAPPHWLSSAAVPNAAKLAFLVRNQWVRLWSSHRADWAFPCVCELRLHVSDASPFLRDLPVGSVRFRLWCSESSTGALDLDPGQRASISCVMFADSVVSIDAISTRHGAVIGGARIPMAEFANHDKDGCLHIVLALAAGPPSTIDVGFQVKQRGRLPAELGGFDVRQFNRIESQYIMQELLGDASAVDEWERSASGEITRALFATDPLLTMQMLALTPRPKVWTQKVIINRLLACDFQSACRCLAHYVAGHDDWLDLLELVLMYAYDHPVWASMRSTLFKEAGVAADGCTSREAGRSRQCRQVLAMAVLGIVPDKGTVSSIMSHVDDFVRQWDPLVDGRLPNCFLEYSASCNASYRQAQTRFWTEYRTIVRVHRLPALEYPVQCALHYIRNREWNMARLAILPFPNLHSQVVLAALDDHGGTGGGFEFNRCLFEEMWRHRPSDTLAWAHHPSDRRCTMVQFYIDLVGTAVSDPIEQASVLSDLVRSRDVDLLTHLGRVLTSVPHRDGRSGQIARFRETHSRTRGDDFDHGAHTLLACSALDAFHDQVTAGERDFPMSLSATISAIADYIAQMDMAQYKVDLVRSMFVLLFCVRPDQPGDKSGRVRFCLTLAHFTRLLQALQRQIQAVQDKGVPNDEVQKAIGDLDDVIVDCLRRSDAVRQLDGIQATLHDVSAPIDAIRIRFVERGQVETGRRALRFYDDAGRSVFDATTLWDDLLHSVQGADTDSVVSLLTGADMTSWERFQHAIDLVLVHSDVRPALMPIVQSSLQACPDFDREQAMLAEQALALATADSPSADAVEQDTGTAVCADGALLEAIREAAKGDACCGLLLTMQYAIRSATTLADLDRAIRECDGYVARCAGDAEWVHSRLLRVRAWASINQASATINRPTLHHLCDNLWVADPAQDDDLVVTMLSERVGQAPCQERIARDALQAIGELVHDANGDRVREFRDHVLQVLLENRPEGQSLDDLYADLMMFTSPSHCARITLDVITLFRDADRARRLVRHNVGNLQNGAGNGGREARAQLARFERLSAFLDVYVATPAEMMDWVDYLHRCDADFAGALAQACNNAQSMRLASGLVALFEKGVFEVPGDFNYAKFALQRQTISIAMCFQENSTVQERMVGCDRLAAVDLDSLAAIRPLLLRLVQTPDHHAIVATLMARRIPVEGEPCDDGLADTTSDCPISLYERILARPSSSVQQDDALLNAVERWTSDHEWQLKAGIDFVVACYSKCRDRKRATRHRDRLIARLPATSPYERGIVAYMQAMPIH